MQQHTDTISEHLSNETTYAFSTRQCNS